MGPAALQPNTLQYRLSRAALLRSMIPKYCLWLSGKHTLKKAFTGQSISPESVTQHLSCGNGPDPGVRKGDAIRIEPRMAANTRLTHCGGGIRQKE